VGTIERDIRVTAANARDTAFLRIALTADRPSLRLTPPSLSVVSLQNGTPFRVAAAVAVSVPPGTPAFPRAELGPLSCRVLPPAGAPPMTIDRCDADSVAVRVTPNAASGTFSYRVEVTAPRGAAPVDPGVLTVNVNFAVAPPPPAPFLASNVIDGRCAADLEYKLFCWGSNSTGQLGDGTIIRKLRANPVSTAAGPFMQRNIFVPLPTAGGGHTCAPISRVNGSASLHCWGSNSSGETGLGTFTGNTLLPQPVAVPGGIGAFRTSAGNRTTCIIAADATSADVNRVYCWGSNQFGQLGNGSTEAFTNAPSTQAVIPRTAFTAIAVGDTHACVVATGLPPFYLGTVYCWGQGWMLGNGSTSGTLVQRTAVAVPLPVRLQQQIGSEGIAYTLEAGADVTCVITNDDGLYCWGMNSYGAAGNGTRSIVAVPTRVQFPGVPVYGFTQLVGNQIGVGERHVCAIIIDEVWCWGDNTYGQLGSGAINDGGSNVPVRVQTTLRFRYISAGVFTTCGVATDNTVWCWGYGLTGELGNGQDSANSVVPVQVLPPL
jgi:alpha-tubulin suppressor-like RCC1 family protein